MAFQKGVIPWNKGIKGAIPWNKGIKTGLVPKSAFKKGDKFWLGKKRSEEDKKLMSDAHIGNAGFWTGKRRLDVSGENHYNWRGGVTTKNEKIRKSLEYKLWRKSCFERDNFTCQISGESGGELVVHHINNFADYPELRTTISNGITMTKKIHKEFHKIYGKRNNTKEQLEEFLA